MATLLLLLRVGLIPLPPFPCLHRHEDMGKKPVGQMRSRNRNLGLMKALGSLNLVRAAANRQAAFAGSFPDPAGDP